MEKQTVQNFENHARVVPPFHFFVLPVLLINVIWSLIELRHGISVGSVLAVLVAVALLMAALFARLFALTVQDRVIRLEMQLRMERLLSQELRPRIPEFTAEQLIGLRFAGDDELPALARQALDEKLAHRKEIKKRVKNWRPDYLRT